MRNKNKPLTKKQRLNLIDAWAITNCLCAYLRNSPSYTNKYCAADEAKKIYQKLDSVVATMYEDDL